MGDYIDDVAPGSVIVLDNNGRDDCTVWGDILTEIAHRRGIAGTVINGINRDTHLCLSLGYPVFSIDNWMRTGKDRVQVEATGIPVSKMLEGERDKLLKMEQSLGQRVIGQTEAVLAVSSTHAPKRSLQNGRLVDLWWQFVAWWSAGSESAGGEGQCPCWATFWRSWSERWQHALWGPRSEAREWLCNP